MFVLKHVLSTWSERMKTTCPSVQNMPWHINQSFIAELLLLKYIMGDMESLNPEFGLYGNRLEGARNDNVFNSLSEVSTRAVTTHNFTLA